MCKCGRPLSLKPSLLWALPRSSGEAYSAPPDSLASPGKRRGGRWTGKGGD